MAFPELEFLEMSMDIAYKRGFYNLEWKIARLRYIFPAEFLRTFLTFYTESLWGLVRGTMYHVHMHYTWDPFFHKHYL